MQRRIGRGTPWLPVVSPTVARRRAAFFVVCAITFSMVISLGARMLWSQDSAALAAVPDAASREVAPDCLLVVSGAPVGLTVALARQLTDAAGHDQNLGLADPVTAESVRTLWPSQATQAAAVASALRGLTGPALSCSATLGPATTQTLGADGLTPRAQAVWVAVGRIFGVLPAGGFRPGGVTTGHVPGSAHYEGRAIDYMYRPVTVKSLAHGWVLAQWLTAHAQPLLIRTIIFDKKIWTPTADVSTTWRDYTVTYGQTEDPTLEHLDHVHVDVTRGA